MTLDEIQTMARASGLLHLEKNTRFGPPDDVLERFAELVAEAERGACAKICEELPSGMFAYEASYAIRESAKAKK